MKNNPMYGSLHKTTIDHEGESTITLKIPLSELDKLLKIAQLTEQLLEISIEPSNKKHYEVAELS